MENHSIAFSNMSGDGVHEKIIEVAIPYLPNAQILILGAGQGALESKLMQSGILSENIKAVDYNPSQYKLNNVKIEFCDLNGALPFADRSFDICFAIEVIEHLNNPQNLIDESWKVLKPAGMLFLSTPNVHSIMQKIRFLFSDKLGWFFERDFLGSGHIHPIFDWLLERMVRNKFELIEYTSQTFHLRIVPKFPAIPVPFEHRLFAVNNIYAYRKLDSDA